MADRKESLRVCFWLLVCDVAEAVHIDRLWLYAIGRAAHCVDYGDKPPAVPGRGPFDSRGDSPKLKGSPDV
jgi:hypothetical protein